MNRLITKCVGLGPGMLWTIRRRGRWAVWCVATLMMTWTPALGGPYLDKACNMGDWLVANANANGVWDTQAKFYKVANNMLALTELHAVTAEGSYLSSATDAVSYVTTNLQLMDETTAESWTYSGAGGMDFDAETWQDSYGLIMSSGTPGAVAQYANTWGQAVHTSALARLNQTNGSFAANVAAVRSWLESSSHGSPETNYSGLVYKRMTDAYTQQHGVIPSNNIYHTYGDNPYPFKLWTESQGACISALLAVGNATIATELGDWLVDPNYGWNAADGQFNTFYDFDIAQANYNQNTGQDEGAYSADDDIICGLIQLYESNPSAPNADAYLQRAIDSMDETLATEGSSSQIRALKDLHVHTGDSVYLTEALARADEYLAIDPSTYGWGNGSKILRLLAAEQLYQQSLIPEPATVVLLALGGLGLLLLRRKLRRRRTVGAVLRILMAAVIGAQCVVSAPAAVWYVNPGESIQAAIDSASAGDTISVAAGMYSEHLTIATSDLTLLGEDKHTTIIDARQDSSWSVAKAGILIGEYPYVDGVGGVNISGFTIQNARLDETGGAYSGNRYGVGPGGLAGIQIYNSSDNTIEDNILVNNYWQTWLVAEWAAAGYSECKNNEIANNVIRDSQADGVYLYSDGTVFVEDTQVVGNEIFNLTGTYTSGVEFWGYKERAEDPDPAITGTVVEGNDIHDCTYGVRIRSGVGDITGTYINHNKIYDNTSHGVRNYLTTVVDTQNNWWGDATGPFHPTLNPDGLGNQVSDYVDFEPWVSTAIPEPGTAALLVCGLAALLFGAMIRRRRRRA